MVTHKGKEDEIDIKNFSMGNMYAQVYSKGLKMMNVKKINLSNNRLNDMGSDNILNGMNNNV